MRAKRNMVLVIPP